MSGTRRNPYAVTVDVVKPGRARSNHSPEARRRENEPRSPVATRRQRCAIYTRVSSDSKLEQDFNSLDAQREASEAYVKSQAHEGWSLLRLRYDDGGFSGGSVERPALQQLLEDIRSGLIDIIVVYKVDRLTRSLADFARLVDLFDAHQVSFVSVTQSFNTTTSMGRLTLNVLLSFAQFEREVTGERIRDKIAASKKKGLWMGGVVSLGYRVEDRRLIIVPDHAAVVRMIFNRYLETGSVLKLKAALDSDGTTVPLRINGKGQQTGGGLFSRGHLHQILTNPIYIGKLSHKGQTHDGQHEAIIDLVLFRTVQDLFAARQQVSRHRSGRSDALLAGLLHDDRGNRMSPSWVRKQSKRWRYYVSQALLQGRRDQTGSVPRVAAEEIEDALLKGLAQHKVLPLLSASCNERRAVLRQIIERINLGKSRIIVTLAPSDEGGDQQTTDSTAQDNRYAGARQGTSWCGQQTNCDAPHLLMEANGGADHSDRELDNRAITDGTDRSLVTGDAFSRTIIIPWSRRSTRRRHEIIPAHRPGVDNARPMRVEARAKLVTALAKAHRWLDALMNDPSASITTLASAEQKSERSIRLTLSLAFVAPDIIDAAIQRKLPRGFNASRLMDLPHRWDDQRKLLGIG